MNSALVLVWTDQTPAAKLNYECEESSETESSQVKSTHNTSVKYPFLWGFVRENGQDDATERTVLPSHFWTARGAIPSTKTEGSYA